MSFIKIVVILLAFFVHTKKVYIFDLLFAFLFCLDKSATSVLEICVLTMGPVLANLMTIVAYALMASLGKTVKLVRFNIS